MTNPQLRIVIPACNEAQRIVPTLRDFCETFSGRARVVVVANGCTDDTVEIIQRLQGEYTNLDVMNIPGRIGKGGAVRAGFAIGKEPYIGFVDADGSTTAAEFSRLVKICQTGECDAVIGSRWLSGAIVEPAQPWLRRLASRTFNRIVRILFGLRLADTQCGAKVFSRRALQDIMSSLEVADFAFDIEVLWRLSRHGFVVHEIPTVWSDRSEGTKIQIVRSSRSMLSTVLRMRLRDSMIWRLPFLEYFGRDGVIPVKDGLSLLVVADEPNAGSPAALLFAELARRGCRIEYATRMSRRRLGFFWWYLTSSKRQYDALVEIETSFPWLIPAMSAKETFVLCEGNADSRGQALYGLYRRSHRIVLSCDNVGLVADKIVSQIGGGLYRAHFHSNGDTHVLNFSDHRSGEWSQHVLQ